ncbi:MAG TPA: urease accessory protein UreF [Candidatus Binatia bacterium]|jgi:urease accessory protein|nr:urease accessory protein UreF [Candidatus Binatia bacterium]
MKSAADMKLARLLQLASPILPVGAYSYSQGLESAVAAGAVGDLETAHCWIGDLLEYSVGHIEPPLLSRLIASWTAQDFTLAVQWNALFLASRETSELRAETLQMGYSLRKLVMELEEADEKALAHLARLEEISFPAAFAFAAAQWKVPAQPAVVAYLWAWLEGQVTAAVKLVPLGQTDGQWMLFALGDRLLPIAERAASMSNDDIGGFAPGLAIFSSRHETQYSRLFRS